MLLLSALDKNLQTNQSFVGFHRISVQEARGLFSDMNFVPLLAYILLVLQIMLVEAFTNSFAWRDQGSECSLLFKPSMLRTHSINVKGLKVSNPRPRRLFGQLKVKSGSELPVINTETPVWETISSQLTPLQPSPNSQITFYRNRNGWCLYSQRVWMALEHKNIRYDVCTISSKNMPQWYKDIVPTKQVPAIELHDVNWKSSTPGSGRVLWGSMDIVKSLDELFPNSDPHLSHKTRFESDFLALTESFDSAALRYVFDAGKPLLDLALRRATFTACLKSLNDALVQSGGPFASGPSLGAADLALIPFIERYRYQVPLFDPDGPALYGNPDFPALTRWYDEVAALPSFARSCGDAYTWTAIASTASRLVAPRPPSPARQAACEAADRAASRMLDDLAGQPGAAYGAWEEEPRIEAVRLVR